MNTPGAPPYISAYALTAANTTRDFYIRTFHALGLDLDAELDRLATKYGRERKRGPATGALSRIPARYLAAETEMKRRGFIWRDDVKKWVPAQSWD